ncbi:MAG: hypothetical protein GY944_11760 [bacterium]|nr:hypothetical protein [bacterium]
MKFPRQLSSGVTVRGTGRTVLSMIIAFLVGPFVLTSCANYGIPLHEIAPEVNRTLYTGPTIIQPGNEIDVRFPLIPAWNYLGKVRLDGKVSFPQLGEVIVAGHSIEDLRKILIEGYGKTNGSPRDIVINLGNAAADVPEDSRGVTVTGELNIPGLVMLSGHRMSLVDAIGLAGGHLKESALLANTLLVRRSPVTGTQQSWRIDARIDHWGKGDPLFLQPFDLVLVPNTPIDDVNIWIDKYITQMIPGAGIVPFIVGAAVVN